MRFGRDVRGLPTRVARNWCQNRSFGESGYGHNVRERHTKVVHVCEQSPMHVCGAYYSILEGNRRSIAST